MTEPTDPALPVGLAERVAVEAARLMRTATAGLTRTERRRQRRLAHIVDDVVLRDLTFALTDEVLRFADRRRAADRFAAIVASSGIPASLPALDRWSLRIGALFARRLPWPVVDLVRARLLREASGVVLPAEDPAFAAHLARRRAEHTRVNVNVLGEAILSDAEAAERLRMIRARIARPDVDYVSLKISAVCANLDVLAFDHSVDRVAETLREVYRDAMRTSPSAPPTFVNLDMEEHRDLELTIASMQRVLDEDEFAAIDAGIVLQAYLPDSHDAAERLGAWALARHARRGGRLKVRVVKGANLAMERVEAELHGWEQAPYSTKHEVDASFKRLIERLLDPAWNECIRVGIASHNLFDLAWALLLCTDPVVDARVDIEMLEGMAPAQARAVRDAAGDLLLYAPVVRKDDLPASIAYLTRRLDENTSADNFLRALFTLEVGTEAWEEQRARFEAALAARNTVSTTSRRAQDRTAAVTRAEESFHNAADTDWTVAANRAWIAAHLAADPPAAVEVEVTTTAAVDAVIERATAAAAVWRTTSFVERRRVLERVADVMEAERGTTLSVMAHEAAKTVGEGDPEVSEAIDFARYGAACTHDLEARVLAGHTFEPVGVVLVASPWNFPYAIPAGGVFAALAAGNAVILKPAPEVRATARVLVDQLRRAGVPQDAVQFLACHDDEVGRHLVCHGGIDTVLLTGAYDTAAMFLDWKPSMRLFAETSGKNAVVVTAAADEDAAIRDIVHSAFGHAGQKCSAASLVIVEASLFDDVRFRRRLADAVESIRVGDATDLATMMGPLIGPPQGALLRALTTLDPGETWLVEPRRVGDRSDESGALWTPGVRWNVAAGSWFHRTECFGPVLGVLRADDLDHAIELQNGVDLGLTGGIHSLDDGEVRHWLDRVQVGNAYVNRHITGAVVRRQPFGGWKRSSVGCGAKAGGPWFVEQLGTWTATTAMMAMMGTASAPAEVERAWREQFVDESDPSGLTCERNVLRHRPLRRVALLIGADADPRQVAVIRTAARVAGVSVVDWTGVVGVDTGVAGVSVVDRTGVDRVRAIGTITDDDRRAVRAAGLDLDETAPVAIPEIELRRWVREQAISWTRHRHGRLLD